MAGTQNKALGHSSISTALNAGYQASPRNSTIADGLRALHGARTSAKLAAEIQYQTRTDEKGDIPPTA
jgi:hypothetical protein